jgi:hypothetical protein
MFYPVHAHLLVGDFSCVAYRRVTAGPTPGRATAALVTCAVSVIGAWTIVGVRTESLVNNEIPNLRIAKYVSGNSTKRSENERNDPECSNRQSR